jgi:hypothetical protein
MPAAEKLADYAEDQASVERIRRMRDFRRWVQAHKAEIESEVVFGNEHDRQSTKSHWVRREVIDQAWRILRERRKR